MPSKDLQSTGLNDYETPPEIFRHWHNLFSFELDVCAAHYNTKLPDFYSEERSCFTNPWKSRNWMNPPYNKPENPCKPVGCAKITCHERGHCITEYRPGLCDFVKRAYEQSLEGKLVVALIPSSRATEWWQSYVHQKAGHIYDYPKRINFLQNGKVVKGVAFDPCIVIWGLHPAARPATTSLFPAEAL